MEYIALNNGIKCPVVGIGTFMLSPAEAENSVREALKMGYSLWRRILISPRQSSERPWTSTASSS